MRAFLLGVFLLALLIASVPKNTANAATGLVQRRVSNASRQKASAIAAIKAYCNELERYFGKNPKATRYFVDALPEEQANASPAAKAAWYEVKDENEMLDAERGYAHRSIAISMKDGAIVKAEIAEPMEHSRTADAYYFRPDGTLARADSDFYGNMQEAHILRDNYYNADGRLLQATARCFRIFYTSNGNREKRVSCRRAEMSGQIASHPIPVYPRPANLPGYDALKNR